MFELTVFSFCQFHHVIDGRFTDTPDVMGQIASSGFERRQTDVQSGHRCATHCQMKLPRLYGSELAFPVLLHVMSARVMDKGASRAKETGTQTISSYE